MNAQDVMDTLDQLGIEYYQDQENLDYMVGIKHEGTNAEKMFEAPTPDGPWELIRYDGDTVWDAANTPEEINDLLERSKQMGGIVQPGTDLSLADRISTAFDDVEMPEPQDIIKGTVHDMVENTASVCHEVLEEVLELLKQRAKDLAVPFTSQEANQIWLNEVENTVKFMEANFPLEIMILGIQQLCKSVRFPERSIGSLPVLDRIMNEYQELFTV